MLARDWRAGELTVLGIALVLAVAALTSVGFLSDRVEQALKLESHQLLGGDLLLTSDHPWTDETRDELRKRGLRTAESMSFASMVAANGSTQLAEIKAVSSGYPLRGTLRIAPAINQPDAAVDRVPASGEVWPDERTVTALSLTPASGLSLGKAQLTVGPVLTVEPDRGMNVFALAPRLMLNMADVEKTGLIQRGSRVAYRLHVAGEAGVVADFERWITPRLGRGQKVESMENARPEVRTLIERAQRFMRLAALLAVVLAAVAVALAAERYLRRHLDGCAVMRCMGAREAQLLAIHGGEFLLFGVIATLVGSVLGYGVQAAMQVLLAGLLFPSLPAPSLLPWLHGILVGLVLVADHSGATTRMGRCRCRLPVCLSCRCSGVGGPHVLDGGRRKVMAGRAHRLFARTGLVCRRGDVAVGPDRPTATGRRRLWLASRPGQPWATSAGNAGSGGGAGPRSHCLVAAHGGAGRSA
jgi:putative ABC transport system permease protein